MSSSTATPPNNSNRQRFKRNRGVQQRSGDRVAAHFAYGVVRLGRHVAPAVHDLPRRPICSCELGRAVRNRLQRAFAVWVWPVRDVAVEILPAVAGRAVDACAWVCFPAPERQRIIDIALLLGNSTRARLRSVSACHPPLYGVVLWMTVPQAAHVYGPKCFRSESKNACSPEEGPSPLQPA